jgi:hypothetical protein
LISLSNLPWVLFPIPGTCSSLVNEGTILLLIHNPSSTIRGTHYQFYLGMLLQLQISTFQLDRWHCQSVRNFPFPRVFISHAVPISMFPLSYRAGHLWRGDIPSMDLERSCFPTTWVRWKVFYCPTCSNFVSDLSVSFSVVNWVVLPRY